MNRLALADGEGRSCYALSSGQGSPLNGLLQYLRFGVRQLRKTPASAVLGIMVLALGGLFTVFDNLLLHSFPYTDSERFQSVSTAEGSAGLGGGAVSPSDYLDGEAQNGVFSFLAASRSWPVNLRTGRRARLRSTVTSKDRKGRSCGGAAARVRKLR